MWVKAWMFKWHNPNLKTGASPRRCSDHVSEGNMGTGMEGTMSVPPSCSQASILGTDTAELQLLVVPRALCWSPLPEPAAPLLFPGPKFGPLNPRSKFTPTPVHLHPFSQYIWKLTVIYSKAAPIPHTQDPCLPLPSLPNTFLSRFSPTTPFHFYTFALYSHLCPLPDSPLPTWGARQPLSSQQSHLRWHFCSFCSTCCPSPKLRPLPAFTATQAHIFLGPGTWKVVQASISKARMLPTLARSLPRSTLKQLKIRCTQEE